MVETGRLLLFVVDVAPQHTVQTNTNIGTANLAPQHMLKSTYSNTAAGTHACELVQIHTSDIIHIYVHTCAFTASLK